MSQFTSQLAGHRHLLVVVLFAAILLSNGCGGYTLKYKLIKEDIVISDTSKPLKVLVMTFSDLRPPEERSEPARRQLKYGDLGDYTYDREFKGDISEEIPKMLVKHLVYSKVFSGIRFAATAQNDITEEYLDTLKYRGIDAIFTGEINHFYGFYYTDAVDIVVPLAMWGAVAIPVTVGAAKRTKTTYVMGTEIVTTETDWGTQIGGELAGWLAYKIGEVLTNTRARDFEWRTNLSVRLVSTCNYEIVWEDTFESHSEGRRAFAGFGKNKYLLAVESLRDAVNQMVMSLSKASFETEITHLPVERDFLPTFRLKLKLGETTSILDNEVLLTYAQQESSSAVFSFKNIIGVARDLEGPFQDTSLQVEEKDVFYVQVRTFIVYRVQVVQDRDGVSLNFEEM